MLLALLNHSPDKYVPILFDEAGKPQLCPSASFLMLIV